MAKQDVGERDEREEMEADHSEPRVYELGFHIDPELTEGDAKKVYQGIRDVISEAGEVVAEGAPQKIQLAYTVSRMEHGGRRDFDNSYFAWIAYEADGQGHEKVASAARAEGSIFRFLDIRSDKEQAQHFAEMQELMMKAPEKGEEVSDTELDAALKEVEV